MVYEQSMYEPVRNFLINGKLECHREVPMYSRRIDVVGISKDYSNITAVEMKVRDWKKALRQANLYRLCADYVYVAMYYKHIPRDLESFRSKGIGVFEVNGDVKLVEKAMPSDIIHNSIRNSIINYIEKKG